MPEIVRAATRAELRRFFALSRGAGYRKAEQAYLRRFAPAPDEDHIYLLAAGGCACARLLSWRDEAYDRAVSRRCAFFALLDGDAACFGALLDEAQAHWRQKGCDRMIGPVAPDGSGLFSGQCSGECAQTGLFAGPGDRGQTAALLAAGFQPLAREEAFFLDVPAINKYVPYARRLEARFGLRVGRAGRGLWTCSLPRAAYEVAERLKRESARQAEKLLRYTDTRFSFAALDEAGSCLGYVLTLRDAPRPRVATFMTRNVPCRRAVTLCLMSALCDALIRRGVQQAELSVIDETNLPSIRLALGAGARRARSYVRYYKEIT